MSLEGEEAFNSGVKRRNGIGHGNLPETSGYLWLAVWRIENGRAS
jgi:hypothetical protein